MMVEYLMISLCSDPGQVVHTHVLSLSLNAFATNYPVAAKDIQFSGCLLHVTITITTTNTTITTTSPSPPIDNVGAMIFVWR